MSIAGIILAAGYSSRAGCFKMTKELIGKPVIEHVIGAMDTVCDDIIIVTGFGHERLQYLAERYRKVRLLYNKDFNSGMFSSVLAGVRQCKADRIFITPGDCAAVGTDTYCALARTTGEIQVPFYHGQSGHPICISEKVAVRLLCSTYKSLHEFIDSHKYIAVAVDDNGIQMDLDTPKDFLRMEAYLNGLKVCLQSSPER